MQEDVLYFFQSIRIPALDYFFNLMSFLAEQYIFIAILSFIYWNVSKKYGFALSFTFLFSVSVNGLFKILFHTPRPFQVLQKLKAKRLFTATGYAFPSGHTQSATTFYLSMAEWLRKFWFWIIALLITVFVGISRLYLGVHWPIDVLGGWFLGLIFAIWFYRHIIRLMNKPKTFHFMIVASTAVLLMILGGLIYINVSSIFHVNYRDYLKIIATITGSTLGYFIDIKTLDFNVNASKIKKWLRYLVGFVGIILIIAGLKTFKIENEGFTFLRYFLVGIWITYLFPLLGQALRLFEK